MSISDDDVPPPLEDMSVLVDRVKEKNESKPKQAVNNKSLEDKTLKPVASSQANQSKQKSSTSNTGYGGMRKGFLFGKKSQADKLSKSVSTCDKEKSSVKTPDYVVKPKTDAQSELVINEVQQAMDQVKGDFMKNKETWLTDDLMKNVEKNEKLLKQLSDPKFSQAVQWMQKDPKAAMEYYKDDKDVQVFFQEFSKILGTHFTSLGDQANIANTGNASSSNSSTEKSEEEVKMDKILSNPEIRQILSRPDVQNLLHVLRSNPDEGQRLFYSSDARFKADVQKLVAAGLLNFESKK